MLAGSRLPFEIVPVKAWEDRPTTRARRLPARARLHAVAGLLGLTALASALAGGTPAVGPLEPLRNSSHYAR